MKINSITLTNHAGEESRILKNVRHGLNVYYSSTESDKTACASLVANLLYGQPKERWDRTLERPFALGNISIETNGRQYEVKRRDYNIHGGQLAVTPTDGLPADQKSIQAIFSKLAPEVARLSSINFHEPLPMDWLLSKNVTAAFQEMQGIQSRKGRCSASSTLHKTTLQSESYSELINKRDQLSKELERRIASNRKQSQAFDQKWQNVDTKYRKYLGEVNSLRDQVRTVEANLAEVETRLKYLRLESSEYSVSYVNDLEVQLQELNEQITRWHSILDRHSQRLAEVQSQLSRLPSINDTTEIQTLADQRAWLTVARRMASDIDGEVARLARAREDHTCVCLNAHPRLRPMTDAMQHQLDAFEEHVTHQEQIALAKELSAEAKFLTSSRDELKEPLQALLDRQRFLTTHLNTARSIRSRGFAGYMSVSRDKRLADDWTSYEAELSHLEEEYAELTKENKKLQALLGKAEPRFYDVKEQREKLNSQRTELISIRSTEEIHEELSAVQSSLQAITSDEIEKPILEGWALASEFLAQVTNGQLLHIRPATKQRAAGIITRLDQTKGISSLTPSECDLVCLSVCLAMIETCREHGLRLPLVLNEPFLRFDERSTSAVAAVLDDFARRGHQVLLFTGNRFAAEHFNTVEMDWRFQDGPTIKNTLQDRRVDIPDTTEQLEDNSEPSSISFSFFAHEESNIFEVFDFPSSWNIAFNEYEVQTITDLWEIEPQDFSVWIEWTGGEEAKPLDISKLQSRAALMCFVPELTNDDAKLLVSVGIKSPEELSEADESLLVYAVDRQLRDTNKQTLLSTRYGRTRIHQWIQGANLHEERWRNSSNWLQCAKTRTASSPSDGLAQGDVGSRRFYLSRAADVIAAPSIGSKTAARLNNIGVKTVGDLLDLAPAKASKQIDVKSIRPETIRSWQQQANLMCSIPELHSHDAQILTACDLIHPQDIANMEPGQLLAHISPFCHSKPAERILRSEKRPGLKEVSNWINCAKHRTVAGAA